MESRLLRIFTILSLALATHAAVSPESYWNSVLPNTPIPKAIRDILHPDLTEEKSTSVSVGKGGVNVDAGKGKAGGTNVNVGKGGVGVDAGQGKPGHTSVNVGKGGVGVDAGQEKPGHTSVNVGKGGVGVDAGQGKPGHTSVNVGKGGVGVNAGKGKPGGTTVNVGKGGVNVHVGKGKHYATTSPFNYQYAATETQVHDDPNVALFFLEKDLKPGKKMSLHFIKNSDTSTFLPRQVAKSIPFTSDKFPEILNKLDVKPGSNDAKTMKSTIQECENSAIKGEEKYCATSLESMIDFSTSKLGKKVKAISTEVDKETEMQKYTIKHGLKNVRGEKLVACHKQNYPYAVFYCHVTDTTRAYVVPLEGADGTKAQAVAVCHLNTSEWNPKHLAFQVLKVKPGTVPVCHFLPEDHVVWVRN